MKNLLVLAGVRLASATIPPWVAPGPNDLRGPCPGLNTLANHGLLPHSGQNITVDDLAYGMLAGVNQDESISLGLFNILVREGLTSGNTTDSTFSLEGLGRHNVLEHDASLSRQDAYFGNPLVFNQAAWDETLRYWHDDHITINTSAAARAARIRTSNATNPQFGLSSLAKGFASGESIAFIMVFGDVDAGVVDTKSVKYWFENERFPPWYAPPAEVVTNNTLFDLQSRFNEAILAEGLNYSDIAAPPTTGERRGIHSSLWVA